MSPKEKFILQYWPLAAGVGLRWGVNPNAILAVAAEEGALGTSFSARTRRNHFGLKVKGKWAVFATDAACFEYFGQLMARKYEAAALVSGDPAAFVQRMTQTNYVSENPAGKARWARNVVSYWRAAAAVAVQQGLQPANPVAATYTVSPRS